MVCSLVSIYFNSLQFDIQWKQTMKLYEDHWFRDMPMPNFYFLKKDLGTVSPPHFVYDFSGKIFLMLFWFLILIILRTKKAFKVKPKTFFIIVKGLSVIKNFLRPERAPLSLSRVSLICTKSFSKTVIHT